MALTSPSPRPRKLHTLHLEAGSRAGASAEETELRRKIAELEKLLAAGPGEAKARRAARKSIVPAQDTRDSATSFGNRHRLTKAEQRALARERQRHIVISMILVALVVGLANWLAQLLHS